MLVTLHAGQVQVPQALQPGQLESDTLAEASKGVQRVYTWNDAVLTQASCLQQPARETLEAISTPIQPQQPLQQ